MLLHLALAALLLRHTPRSLPHTAPTTLTVHNVEAPTVLAPPPADAGPIAVELKEPTVEAISDATTTRCEVATQLGATLGRNEPVVATLAAGDVPQDVRRVIMVWDGRWTNAADPTLRQAVTTVVAALDATCSDAPQNGPQLVFVTTSTAAVTIAVGSGQWRWRDLLSASGNVAPVHQN